MLFVCTLLTEVQPINKSPLPPPLLSSEKDLEKINVDNFVWEWILLKMVYLVAQDYCLFFLRVHVYCICSLLTTNVLLESLQDSSK